ncbi:hypothetical protein [Mesoplasma florum]|uniref:hypothetical protein n=1 Tax=Mesoplasma florum TaxID=2151 RepID=UPI000BE2A043|nr:hypothetical protein [Mesoplasma florum]ATI74033.1 hypothetical protein CQZ70_02095 [Mesoplasma florum]
MFKQNLTKVICIIYSTISAIISLQLFGFLLIFIISKITNNSDLSETMKSIFIKSFVGFIILYFLLGFIFCSITTYLMWYSFKQNKFDKKVLFFAIPSILAMIYSIPLYFILFKYYRHFKIDKVK